jgi:hypothetical protein
MSAFIVDPAQIDVILSVALHGPLEPGYAWDWTPPYINELLEAEGRSGPLSRETIDLAGQKLLLRCVTSVSSQTGEPLGNLPGPMPNPVPGQYEWTDFGHILSPVETCAALDCYEYQSSEDAAWWPSGANVFCQRLRRSLVRQIRGYREAPALWTTDLALARAPRISGRSFA